MKTLLILILIASVIASCRSYPRYRTQSSVTPRDQTAGKQLTTDDYLRFSMILQEYLGRPYKSRSSYGEGLDCSLFTLEVYRRFNRTMLPRTSSEQYLEGRVVPRTRLKYGDLVFYKTDRKQIGHVGIYVNKNEFIHASTTRGVIISNMSEDYWSRRYIGARRILE